jgi:hypothetical protein
VARATRPPAGQAGRRAGSSV